MQSSSREDCSAVLAEAGFGSSPAATMAAWRLRSVMAVAKRSWRRAMRTAPGDMAEASCCSAVSEKPSEAATAIRSARLWSVTARAMPPPM
jgi:hypothetical protein